MATKPQLGLMAASTASFGLVHIILSQIFKKRFDQRTRKKDAKDIHWKMACRVVAIVHACGVTWWGFKRFFETRGVSWLAANGFVEARIQAFSFGFFIQDFVYVMVKEWDIMFVLHHVAVLAILVTSMLTKAAGRICIFGLALGEATNVFQNSYWMARALQATWAQDIILPVFNVAFIATRLIAAPYYSYGIMKQCLTSGLPAGKLYAVLGVGLNAGGFLWAKNLVGYTQNYFKKKTLGKELQLASPPVEPEPEPPSAPGTPPSAPVPPVVDQPVDMSSCHVAGGMAMLRAGRLDTGHVYHVPVMISKVRPDRGGVVYSFTKVGAKDNLVHHARCEASAAALPRSEWYNSVAAFEWVESKSPEMSERLEEIQASLQALGDDHEFDWDHI